MTTNPAALQLVGIKKEATAGTYAAPTTVDHGMLPVTACDWKSVEPRAKDKALRGTMRAQDFGSHQTTRHYELTLKGPVFAGAFGHILMAAFGTDTISGAGPYLHTFSVADTTYPGVPTYSIHLFDGANGANGWGFVAAKLKKLSLAYDKANILQFTADFIAQDRASQSKPTLAVESGAGFGKFDGYTTALTVGGSSDPLWDKFEWEIDRGTEPRHTFNGSRSVSAGHITVAPPVGSFSGSTFYIDQINLNRYLNAQESALVAAVGASNPLLTLTMTSPDWSTGEVKPGDIGDMQRLDVKGDLKFSSTDSGICQAVLTNGRSTAY